MRLLKKVNKVSFVHTWKPSTIKVTALRYPDISYKNILTIAEYAPQHTFVLNTSHPYQLYNLPSNVIPSLLVPCSTALANEFVSCVQETCKLKVATFIIGPAAIHSAQYINFDWFDQVFLVGADARFMERFLFDLVNKHRTTHFWVESIHNRSLKSLGMTNFFNKIKPHMSLHPFLWDNDYLSYKGQL